MAAQTCMIPGLADLPPVAGPDAALSDDELVDQMRGWSRLRAQVHARMLRTMVAVAARSRRAHDPVGVGWAGAEIAAALTWTDGKAARELDFAETLIGRLPWVMAAFEAGDIDHGKAWTFVDVLGDAELTDAQIEAICMALLPLAPKLTTGQLRVRLMRAVLQVDPEYAARRYRRAVRERAVCGYLAADGSGVITGSGLPADEAAAACDRLDELVAAVKRAGHPATRLQLKADVFVRLLDGRLHGMSVEEIIQALLADPTTFPNPDPAPDPGSGPDPGPAGGAAPGPLDPWDQPTPRFDPDPEPAGADPDHRKSGGPVSEPSTLGPSASDGSVPVCWSRPGIEIRVGLATLLGLDERPGEIPGWGPVLPEVARATVARQRGAEWRFAILDPHGYLELAGVTRRRPAMTVRGARGGIVELHITAERLSELAADLERCGQWAGVVADLARQHAESDRFRRELDARPGRRFVRAALRRHIQIRDRTCIAPGCRRPAVACDADHTLGHADGGETCACNIGPLCRKHHLMKAAGWQLEQPEPGLFRWTSPLGQVYETRGEPVGPPLPGPVEREPDETPPEPGPGLRYEGPTFDRTHRADPAPPSRPPPPPRDPTEEPPF